MHRMSARQTLESDTHVWRVPRSNRIADGYWRVPRITRIADGYWAVDIQGARLLDV